MATAVRRSVHTRHREAATAASSDAVARFGVSMTEIVTEDGRTLALGRLAADLNFVTRILWAPIRAEGDRIRAELNLSAGAIGVLFVVAANPGVSQNDVATATRLHKTAVANLVKPMEAAGLLSRVRSHDDARVNLLRVTESGQKLMALAQAMLDDFHQRAFDGISIGDRKTFYRVCAQIIETLDWDDCV